MIQKLLDRAITANFEDLQKRGVQTKAWLQDMMLEEYIDVFWKKVAGLRLDKWGHEVRAMLGPVERAGGDDGDEPPLTMNSIRRSITTWCKSE